MPSLDLSATIKHYLFLTTQSEEVKKLRLFSDGNTGMVFSFKTPLISHFAGSGIRVELPDSFIYGQLDSFQDLYCQGETSLMIVVFHPHGLSQILGIPSQELKNQRIKAEDLFGSKGTALYEKLSDSTAITSKITLAEDFFRKLIASRQLPDQPLILASLNFITQNKGLLPVSKLAAFTGYHERTLERTFITNIGISPKRFSTIVKLHVFLKQLRDQPIQETLTLLGHEAGYYDQPHLIREFKKHTGLTPGQYSSIADPLAINFLSYQPGQHGLLT
ncbi:AraC family transcriptional regulator [Pedobacter cryoconitis]|uniref:AraC family transcriptional regulator n=1 Tax=Pedobacter cryoconitis TaxID=188932 RepID=UPI0018DC3EAE|nr:helix-turn-helix domain-containing protein [Pedobacter cryoconitis]